MARNRTVTHEQWINAVAQLAIARLAPEEAAKMHGLRLAYGSGMSGTYGVTYYDRWNRPDGKAPFVELSAFHQTSLAQLATTTLHELAHVLAGHAAAHGPDWKAAAARLGQRHARATGHKGAWVNLEPDLRFAVLALEPPTEGAPVQTLWGRGDGKGTPTLPPRNPPKPCGGGRGAKGGSSYGASRQTRYECECEPPFRVITSKRQLQAHCDCCAAAFHIVG